MTMIVTFLLSLQKLPKLEIRMTRHLGFDDLPAHFMCKAQIELEQVCFTRWYECYTFVTVSSFTETTKRVITTKRPIETGYFQIQLMLQIPC